MDTSGCLGTSTGLAYTLIASVVYYNLQPPLLIEAQQVSQEDKTGISIALLGLNQCILMPCET